MSPSWKLSAARFSGTVSGRTPIAWFTAQSRRPDILETTWGLVKGLLLQGELPPALKQMIIPPVSTHNDCRYCRMIHTNALEAMGVPRGSDRQRYQDVSPAKLPPTQRAIAEFTSKAAKDPKSIFPATMSRSCGSTV